MAFTGKPLFSQFSETPAMLLKGMLIDGIASIIGEKRGAILLAESPTTVKMTRGSSSTFIAAEPIAKPLTLTGSWSVTFTGPGTGNSTIPNMTLGSWTNHVDPLIHFASGTGTYTTTFQLPDVWLTHSGHVILDLGEVCDLARISCNGVLVAVAWHSPFRADLTAALKQGSNTLTIAVTNTWHNRLVGDEQEPDDCEWGQPYKNMGRSLINFPEWFIAGKPRPSIGRKCFVTWNYMTKDTPLLPAGLIGPVRLIPVAEIPIGARLQQ